MATRTGMVTFGIVNVILASLLLAGMIQGKIPYALSGNPAFVMCLGLAIIFTYAHFKHAFDPRSGFGDFLGGLVTLATGVWATVEYFQWWSFADFIR